MRVTMMCTKVSAHLDFTSEPMFVIEDANDALVRLWPTGEHAWPFMEQLRDVVNAMFDERDKRQREAAAKSIVSAAPDGTP